MLGKMKNLRHILLVIFVCVEVQFLASCQKIESAKYYWTVEEDELEVEKLVVELTEIRKTSPASLERLFSKRIHDDPPRTHATQSRGNRLLVDFKDFLDEDKLFMCTAILRMHHFGLEFQTSDEDTMDIAQQAISLKKLDPSKLATDTLSMFRCPSLRYIDLETDEPVNLLVNYFISGTHEPNSFLLYLQEAPYLPIYPHKFASQVRLAAFDELRVQNDLAVQEDKSNAEKMTVEFEISDTRHWLDKFMDSRKLQKTYQKFQEFFKSWGVCGKPRAHLIAVCRYIAHSLELEVDHRGFDEFGCRKRDIFSKPPEPEDPTSVHLGLLRTVKCPALVSEINGHIKKFTIETMFLAANQLSRSVLMLKRLNLPKQNVVPEAVISSLRLPMLKKDRNRIRELLKPGYIGRKSRNFDLTIEPSRLSDLETFSRGPPFVTFYRNVVEDNTLIFARIKEVKTPYDRFGASYSSININMWPAKDVSYLCHIILRDKLYGFKFDPDFKTDIKFEDRSKIKIQLVTRETELLHDKMVAARRCPRGFQTPSTYFIVGTIFKDAISLHVEYEENNYAFPEAYVQNINKAEIQKVTANENPLDSLM